MGCTDSGPVTELEYVRSLAVRRSGQCRGPVVAIEIVGPRLGTLEASFGEHDWAATLLWDGYQPDRPGMVFWLCSAHWMDLSYLCGVRALQYGHPEWLGEADVLLKQVCRSADWDAKEISNMLRWQHVMLT